MTIGGRVDDHDSGAGALLPIQDPITEQELSNLPTTTQFLNAALSMIGASRINAIDDGSTNANHCRALYPPLLDFLLRKHNWNFNGARAVLVRNSTVPAFGFNYTYVLPGDLLKIRTYNGYNVNVSNLVDFSGVWMQIFILNYTVEAKKILSNDGNVYLGYSKRTTDPTIWDPMFYRLAQTWLASDLARAIPKDDRKADGLLTQAQQLILPEAVAVASQEQAIQYMPVNNLLWGR